jgi:hypothetical protein
LDDNPNPDLESRTLQKIILPLLIMDSLPESIVEQLNETGDYQAIYGGGLDWKQVAALAHKDQRIIVATDPNIKFELLLSGPRQQVICLEGWDEEELLSECIHHIVPGNIPSFGECQHYKAPPKTARLAAPERI